MMNYPRPGPGWQPPQPPSNASRVGLAITLGVCGALLAIGLVAVMVTSRARRSRAAETATAQAQAQAALLHAYALQQQASAQAFAAMTPAQHLAAGQQLFQAGNHAEARRHLEAIPAGAPEHAAAGSFLASIVGAQQQAETAAYQNAARGPQPGASAWDGSYAPVERYLRRTLNDPDSYAHDSCGPVEGVGQFWAVSCSFRARNGFGGMIRQTWRFYVQGGEVHHHTRIN